MENKKAGNLIILSYKSCFVPKCTSTTSRTPLKEFIPVPKNPKIRKKWCEAAGYPEKLIRITSYICEDHFDLSQDMMNYPYWKQIGGAKVIKKGVVPRFFVCQTNDPHPITLDPRRIIEPKSPKIIVCCNPNEENDEFIVPDDLDEMERRVTAPSSPSSQHINETRGTQTKKIVTWAKGTQSRPPSLTSVGTSTNEAPSRTVGTSCSPWNDEFPEIMKIIPMEIDENRENSCDAEIILDPFNGEITQNAREEIFYDKTSRNNDGEDKVAILKRTIYEEATKLLIEENSLSFIGTTKNYLPIIERFSRSSGVSMKNTYLVMKKIRLNLPNKILSAYFGVSESTILPIIRSDLPKISVYLSQWIRWPTSNEIRLNLPVGCSERFGRIHSIIDVFDIHIDRPKVPVTRINEADYVRKYLISITPDGVINYLSSGYNGTTTDIQIVENSEYLSVLPDGVAVLADRNYRIIEILMQKKKCTLIRPPIVLVDLKSTGREKNTINVTSAKDYVEKIVERLREFKFLENRACLRDDLTEYLDQAVILAGSLVNLQTMSVL